MSKIQRKSPGEFLAICRLTELHNVDDLDHEVVAEQRARGVGLIHRKGQSLLPIQCSHEFHDPALFVQHQAADHDRRVNALHARQDQHRPYPVGRWRGPRLTEDGTAFEPSGLEPGATVTWTEYVGTGEWSLGIERRKKVERTGQVWSLVWRPKSAWVVPFELLENELAVQITQDHRGHFHHAETQLRRPQQVKASV